MEFINIEGHASEQSRLRSLIGGVAPCAALLMAFSTAAWADDGGNAVSWTANGAPTEAMIKGGPWTLEQSGAAVGLKSAGYCDASGKQIGNPGTERMQPYYFPTILGHGRYLQGYFDWRPKDIDEAVVAAVSNDAGYTWTFQQRVLELRTTCPTNVNKDPDGDKDFVSPNNSDNIDDDGQGHPYIIKINGHTYLYTLVRAAGHIDQDNLSIHDLTPLFGQPLNGAPALTDASTSAVNRTAPMQTTGLVNPDGILAAIPGTSPLSVIYERKYLNGDNTGTKPYAPAQQCSSNGLDGWGNYYAQNGGLSTNHDITELWLATTTDGITFTDIGRLKGLNDPTTVAANGTRWVATAGTVLQLPGGRYGLFFSGGGCIDADSDAFHYIGYAESNDLLNWTVVNGFDNPIMSVAPVTLSVDASGLPNSGTQITLPAQSPVVGDTHGWFAGRVYGPSATKFTSHDVTLVFAGYHTPKPKNGLGDYRTIGRVSLHSTRPLLIVGNNPEDGGWIGDNR